MESRTRIIPLKVGDEITVMVEAKDLGGEQDVSTLSFQGVNTVCLTTKQPMEWVQR